MTVKTKKLITKKVTAKTPTILPAIGNRATHLFEKYRPCRLADVILLPEHRRAFERFVANRHAPHLLLIGPPGVGKTSVATALPNELGWNIVRKNAAAYLNTDAVRTEIAHYGGPHYTLAPLFGEDEPHDYLLLEEVDHMPGKAQGAMRAMMEEAAAGGHCNFALTANNVRKIDPAIRSRCAEFDFSYDNARDREIITEAYRVRIAAILKAEGMETNMEMIDRLIERHFPDLRAMLNALQLHI